MIKGEIKYSPKEFKRKENVNYHNHNLQVGMCYEQFSKDGELYYYKNVFLPITNTVSVYIQEYAYNHIAHIVDYRDSDGIKWQKQYTPEGFEIYYKEPHKKCGYQFKYLDNRLIYINESGIKLLTNTKDINDIFVIRGVDFSDRFLLENNKLLGYFIQDLSKEKIITKLNAFKLSDELEPAIKIIEEKKGVLIC